jgi:acetylornithine/N-succinyldiaminopimelate aminotransferase
MKITVSCNGKWTMTTTKTIQVEDKYTPPFFRKIPLSIERGAGVHVWDEEGNRFLDLTSGWGSHALVTPIR